MEAILDLTVDSCLHDTPKYLVEYWIIGILEYLWNLDFTEILYILLEYCIFYTRILKNVSDSDFWQTFWTFYQEFGWIY